MKNAVWIIICCAALSAQAKVFNVEIDGERIVADYWIEAEQAWQYIEEGTTNWWSGLSPHPYDCKLWYPHLSNTFNQVLSDQLSTIDALDYAGIDDWRIAHYWDIVPLKCSIFQNPLVLGSKTTVTGFDPTIYFQPTSTNAEGVTAGTSWYTHGRVGDEDGTSVGTATVGGDYKYILNEDGTEELYNVALDLPEADNLLDGTLGFIDQLVYEYFVGKLPTYVNAPHCWSSYMDDGGFNLEVGWFAGDGFTLWRTDSLVSNDWKTVAAQELENNGEACLILRDPAPPAGNAFYRVTTP